MQGASDNFLLADDESTSDEDVSPGKRKRRTIKSTLMVWSKPSLQSRAATTPTVQSASAGVQPPLPYANVNRANRNAYVV